MGSAGLEAGPRWAEADRVRAWAELGHGQRIREAERGLRGGVWGEKLDFRTMGRKQKRAKSGEEKESFFIFRIIFSVKRII
jgi:hypothetical protein